MAWAVKPSSSSKRPKQQKEGGQDGNRSRESAALVLPAHARGQLRQIGTGAGSPGSGRAMLTRAAIGNTNTGPDARMRWHSLADKKAQPYMTLAQPRHSSDVAQPN